MGKRIQPTQGVSGSGGSPYQPGTPKTRQHRAFTPSL